MDISQLGFHIGMGFIAWVTLGAIVTGHEDATRDSYERMMADYEQRLAKANTDYEREVIELSRKMWMESRPVPPKRWY